MESEKHHLQQARETLGLSRASLAERIGVKPRTLKSWELGTRQPDLGKYVRWVESIEAAEMLDELNNVLRHLLDREDERAEQALELLRLVAEQRADDLGHAYVEPAAVRPVWEKVCAACERTKVSEDFLTTRGHLSTLCSSCRKALYCPPARKSTSTTPIAPTPPVDDPYARRSSMVRLRTA